MATNNEINNAGEQYRVDVAIPCRMCQAVGFEPCRTKRGWVMDRRHRCRVEDNARHVLEVNARRLAEQG